MIWRGNWRFGDFAREAASLLYWIKQEPRTMNDLNKLEIVKYIQWKHLEKNQQ